MRTLITLRGFIGYLSDLSKFNYSEILTYLGLKHHQDNLTDLVLNLILSSLAFHIYIIWTWNIFHFNNLMSALCDCYGVIKSKLLDLNWSYLQNRAVTEILKQGGFY